MTKSEALEASILHWQENVKAERPEDVMTGPTNCALCSLFFEDVCEGCPVMRHTGYRGCKNTPYDLADEAFYMWIETYFNADRDVFRKYAQAEVDFLISLRETK